MRALIELSPEPVRVILATCAAVVAGALAGAIVAAVGRYVYLPSVWPALGALGAGAAAMLALRLLKLPGAFRGAVIAGLGGVSVVAAILVTDLALERATVVTELNRSGGLRDDALEARVSASFAERSGSGVLAPVRLRLNEGAPLIPKVRMSLGTAGNTVILLLELLAAGFVAGRLGRAQGSRPYSTHCRQWLERRVVGTAPHGSAATLRSELEQGQFHRLGRRLESPEKSAPVTLCAWMSQGCDCDIVFELQVVEAGDRRARVVLSRPAPHTALDAIFESQDLRHEP